MLSLNICGAAASQHKINQWLVGVVLLDYDSKGIQSIWVRVMCTAANCFCIGFERLETSCEKLVA